MGKYYEHATQKELLQKNKEIFIQYPEGEWSIGLTIHLQNMI